VPYRSTKYFVSSLNTHLGHVIVSRLRNDNEHPENPNRIVGTLSNKGGDQSFSKVPDGVRKVIETEKVQFFQDILLNSDVIIYDLNTCDFQEV